MRSKKITAVAMAMACLATISAHAGAIGDFMKSSKASSSTSVAADEKASIKATPIDPKNKEIPDWLRDSDRLKSMLGAEADFKIENPKVVRRVEAPFPGLEGYVVEATTISEANPEGKQELFVFYTDKSKRYLMVGMMIDMKANRDVNVDVERYVRGELADNPAKALRPQDMNSINVAGTIGSPLTFVVDLGKQAGRESTLNLLRFHQTLKSTGAGVRPIRLVLVSAGDDEFATAAMAMAYGDEVNSGTGLAKVIDFSEKYRDARWLQPNSMGKDAALKRTLGTGIFKMENNSTQALLARIDTLPLVYEGANGRTLNIPLPSTQAQWKALLTKK